MIRELLKRKREEAAQIPKRVRDHSDLFDVAPPTDHSLDPVTSIHDVSNMAGYNGSMYDSMEGVDEMALGRVDARRELDVESATEGPPWQVNEHESILFAESSQLGDEEDIDWTGWL